MRYLCLFLFSFCFLLTACEDEEPPEILTPGDLESIEYNPTPHTVEIPEGFPAMTIPADNPMTEEGFQLGRRLFYDVRLSKDGSMSCASCHLPEMSFTDGVAFSIGVEGEQTRRNSMSLVNVGFFENGLFWDGRVHTLEEQAFMPVTDRVELINTWDRVEKMMREDEVYPRMFREAFGISDRSEIDSVLAVKAIAQFERRLISANSLYDKVIRENDFSFEFTDSEFRGYEIFFELGSIPGGSGLPDGQCVHCHGTELFGIGQYFNNGLDSYPTLADYPDKGRGEVTGEFVDFGRFKSPTLRNIELTAPYMHDGRFNTLEEVIAHYHGGGVKDAENLDANLKEELGLSDQHKADLVAFLKTLTDEEFINNPDFQDPF